MIMNMTTDYRDPLLDLFGTESNSGNETSSPSDIPVINRSGTFNQQQFSPLLTQQSLYNTPNSGSTPNIFDPNYTQMQEEQTSPSSNKLQPEDPPRKKRNTRSQTKIHQQSEGDEYNSNDYKDSIDLDKPPVVEPSPPFFVESDTTPEFVIPTPTSEQQQQQHHELIAQDYQRSNNSNQFGNLTHYEPNLPPLPPLSESILPQTNTFHPLVLPHDPRHAITAGPANNSQQQQQRQQQDSSIPSDGISSKIQQLHAPSLSNNQSASQRKKKESSGPKTRPAFVMKIWSMVNDPANHEFIRWNDDGKTFQVFHREDFMKVILPKYFKHNNFASFVRQLNMYGWHKVQDVANGTLNQNSDKNGQDEIWQFENPNFIKDREDLLDKIVRNKSSSNQDDVSGVSFNGINNSANLSLILQELETIKMNQYVISEDLRRVRQDNKMLWQENYLNRERNQVQGRTLDKILKFLSVVYGNNANKILNGHGFADFSDSNNIMTQYRPSPMGSPLLSRPQTQPPPSNSRFARDNNQTAQPTYESPLSTSDTNNNNNNTFEYQQAVNRPRLMLTNRAHSRRPSMSRTKSTPEGSIEEIIRSYSNDKAAESNVNRMYEQLVGHQPGATTNNNNHSSSTAISAPSPRHSFLQELNLPGTPRNLDDLEKHINKEGQSIQQVQDWIDKLAQEQHEKQQQQQGNDDDDDFDVNEFLKDATTTPSSNVPNGGHYNNGNISFVGSPIAMTPGSNVSSNINDSDGNEKKSKKRSIEEVSDH
ncbi:heat shock transcription factor, other eukaryote [Candida albicans P78048]|uniref:Heat shock transcription factor n=1 Tax=Candida albicans P78048 TaxID=1094989 RepID=A0AB34Q155_CANAX|nr:heat shock transcription factor, other eukaryote [Candida albicans P78048]